MIVKHNLFVPSKKDYVMGKKPDVDCILCAARDKHPDVASLIVHETENFLVTCNLFPFNSGHIMIFPREHIEDLRGIKNENLEELHELTRLSMDILEENYQCQGFNIGYNIGFPSGGSIAHLHLHIIPRYIREMGLIDIIGGAKIVVEDPNDTLKILKKAFEEKTK
jgi:ATP adenylyltransferase